MPENPHDARLPTEEEIATLPLRAQVVFAARCARRVQPLFKWAWPDAPENHLESIDRAIEIGEAFSDESSPSVSADAANAAYAARAAVARAAANAAANAAATADAADATADAVHAPYAARAADAAARAAAHAPNGGEWRPRILAAMRRDFDVLWGLAKKHNWTDDSPVDVALLGPLWPEGEPNGWPTVDDSRPHSDPHDLLPTQEEIATLPLRARVAFAARCARRVQPLLQTTSPLGLKAVEETIARSEAFAGQDDVVVPPHVGYAEGSSLAERAVWDAAVGAYSAATYADAVIGIAKAPHDLAHFQWATTEAAEKACKNAVLASSAGAPDGIDWRSSAIRAMRRDLRLLCGLAAGQGWSDKTRVDLGILGPLWPFGVPEGWPHASSVKLDAHGYRIEIAWDPEVLTDDEYAELIGLLRDLAEAHGATGMERVRERGFGVPVGEGVAL